jgi:bifunctional DNA-binding transcriptional regulator/antitoxin component of YhaV-PrlF toxin-antitoxin module
MEGQQAYRKVQGLGESTFSITLPRHFAETLGIKKGDFVKVALSGSQITVKKAETD